MKKLLITGVSSGIGKALTKRLVEEGNFVWGIARRGYLLKQLQKEVVNDSRFIYSQFDIAPEGSWDKLIKQMKRKKFIPDVVIFNAAINNNDLLPFPALEITKKIFNVNFFSVIEGVKALIKVAKPGAQFIAISSLSALKGSGIEGIGYPASKAALSIAFESLHRKFGDRYRFKTIYFGPVASGMGPFKKALPIILSEEQAVDVIIRAINSNKILYYAPNSLVLIFKLIKLLPQSIYFMLLSLVENTHLKLKNKL